MYTWTMLDNHTRKLLDQCYLAKAAATLCEDKKLELSHVIVSLKILLFKIKESWKKVVWTDGNTKLYKFMNCISYNNRYLANPQALL